MRLQNQDINYHFIFIYVIYINMNEKEETKKMELRIKELETAIHLNGLNKRDGSGDVNKDGFVNEGDSKQILDFLVGKGSLDEDNISNAKVTPGNDTVGLIDIITIQREINNLVNKVNNIVPVSLNDKSIEVRELKGKKLNFDEITTNNLKLKNRNLSSDIQDLSKNVQELRLLSGKDGSFNSISTKTLDVSDELKIKGEKIITLLEEKQKKLEKTSELNIKKLIVENEIIFGSKKIDIGEQIGTFEEQFGKIDVSMNVLMEGGSTKKQINEITTAYKAADQKILDQFDEKLKGSANEYAQSLSKSELNVTKLQVSDAISGGTLDFQEGTIKNLSITKLTVGGIDVFKEYDDTIEILKEGLEVVLSLLSEFLRKNSSV